MDSRNSIKINALAPFRILTSFLQARSIVKTFQPDIAIGTGGYASGPAISVAGKMKIPVFLQEQNVYPGVTTRMLAKYAKVIYASYEDSKKYLQNVKAMGTPLRISLQKQDKNTSLEKFRLNRDKKTIFVFGGSQGSRALNDFLFENVEQIVDETGVQFIWQTGKNDFPEIIEKYVKNPSLHIQTFIYEMDFAYSASDLVICRSGALTLAELCLFNKASILIPLPTAAGNHQELNARSLEKIKAAKVILQKDLSVTGLIDEINQILSNETIKVEMEKSAYKSAKPNAAEIIVKDILNLI